MSIGWDSMHDSRQSFNGSSYAHPLFCALAVSSPAIVPSSVLCCSVEGAATDERRTDTLGLGRSRACISICAHCTACVSRVLCL